MTEADVVAYNELSNKVESLMMEVDRLKGHGEEQALKVQMWMDTADSRLETIRGACMLLDEARDYVHAEHAIACRLYRDYPGLLARKTRVEANLLAKIDGLLKTYLGKDPR
jgi:hypothetical protein